VAVAAVEVAVSFLQNATSWIAADTDAPLLRGAGVTPFHTSFTSFTPDGDALPVDDTAGADGQDVAYASDSGHAGPTDQTTAFERALSRRESLLRHGGDGPEPQPSGFAAAIEAVWAALVIA
jgi:hypothetical protein